MNAEKPGGGPLSEESGRKLVLSFAAAHNRLPELGLGPFFAAQTKAVP